VKNQIHISVPELDINSDGGDTDPKDLSSWGLASGTLARLPTLCSVQ